MGRFITAERTLWTLDGWVDNELVKWSPRGHVLGDAKDMRRAKHWFKQHQIPLHPHITLALPKKHRPVVSRRKHALRAAERVKVHFQHLVHLLREIDPVTWPYDHLAIQVSHALHKQQSAGVVAALSRVLLWDGDIDWRVCWWWQRPTAHSSKLIVWFRMIGIEELSYEPHNDSMRRIPWTFSRDYTTGRISASSSDSSSV